jgi:hypothetical protein
MLENFLDSKYRLFRPSRRLEIKPPPHEHRKMILYNSDWKGEGVADSPEVDSRVVCYEVVDLHAGGLIQKMRAIIGAHFLN